MNLEQERPFVCSAPGCSQVSMGVLCSVWQGTHLPPHREATLPQPLCLLWAFVPHQDTRRVPLTIIFIFIIVIISTLNSLNYFPHHPWNTSVLAIFTQNFPLEVSQMHPAQLTVSSEEGRGVSAFTTVTWITGPLDHWWNGPLSGIEFYFVLLSHLSKINSL